jgi:hypothetical protein
MDQTFCEKIPLDRQFADLFVQLGQPRIVGCGRVAALALANSEPTPSMTVFFQAWIWLAWTP